MTLEHSPAGSTLAAGESLQRRLRSGLIWGFAGRYTGKLMVFLATLVLARVLGPEDFALVALALAILLFLDVANLGVGSTLIWMDKEEADRSRSAAFTLHLTTTIVVVAAIWVFAGPLAAVLSDDPRAPWVIRLLSLSLVLGAAGYIQYTVLERDMDFRRAFRADLAGGLAKGVVSVILALAGGGVWSLVIGQLAGAAITSVALCMIVRFRPRFDLGRGGTAKRLLGYGWHFVVIGLLSSVILNSDYVIVGKVLGLTALGYYVIAFRIPELVLRGVLSTAFTIFFPYYARARELGDDMSGRYIQTLGVVCMVGAPMTAILCGLSTPLIVTLFGAKWEPAAILMPAIAIYGLLDVLGGIAGDIYKATGRPGILTSIGSVRAVVLVAGLSAAAHISIVWVAWFQVALVVAVAVASFTIASRLIPDASLALHGKALAPGLIGGTVAALAGLATGAALPTLAALLVGVPVVLAVYGAFLMTFVPSLRTLVTSAWRRGLRQVSHASS